jgi:predicted histidine transporter YuiF (NhaC family)
MADCCNVYQTITITFLCVITVIIFGLIGFQYKRRNYNNNYNNNNINNNNNNNNNNHNSINSRDPLLHNNNSTIT